ncbi:hypothetical protein C3L33_03237, partial [Rhododendron williamsianum]
MPSWWGKSSSKDSKKKAESFIYSFHRKFRIPSESKPGGKSGGSRRRTIDTVSEKGCQSLARQGLHRVGIGRTDSGISVPSKPRPEKGSKPLSFLPLPRSGCIRNRPDPTDLDGDVVNASFSSECSIDDSEDPTDSRQRSPLASDYENGSRTAAGSPSSMMAKDQSFMELKSREAIKPANQVSALSHKRRPLSNQVANLQVPCRGNFCSAPDSSMSSPSRSPMRAFGAEQAMNSAFWTGKTYPDLPLLGSGQCSSPGSGQNSGHNSMGGDMSGQLFWQPSRGSPEYSPIPSPRMNSPGPSSRIHSGAVTPLHPRAGGPTTDDGKQQSHRLPLPPITISNSSPFSHSNSAATSPSVPRSPGRAENPISPGSRWKKGKLLGRGTFGHVYLGFNSERGEMCAMKEVTLFSDDPKSKECAKQLGQEIALLSRLRHPNIVQYYGCEAVTVYWDIKGANILVDPNGRIKLADFGMAKHITGQSCPLSFKGSPYWMAPEVIKNSNGCNLAVDIWSLGCTVLEMATTKPPWSQFEGVSNLSADVALIILDVAAMFKIGNSKDLPSIPDDLPDDGKDFVRLCLQRNPLNRPTAAKLLEHSFVKNAAPLERPIIGPELSDPPAGVPTAGKSLGFGIKPKPPQSPYISSPSYHDIFRGVNSGSQIFRELLPSESDTCGKQFGRPNHGEPYDGQSVLADRVSQQLLRDNPKLSPSLDLSSCSPLPNRTNGI